MKGRLQTFTAICASIVFPAVSAMALPNAYNYRLGITFSGYAGSAALTNYPVLVKLGAGVTGFDYSQFLSGNSDLRFTDASDTELNYEIDSWDTATDSYVWVQVPLLDASTVIYGYWGFAGDTPPEYTTNGATWSEGYVAVYHFSQTSGSVLLDSTSNQINGTLINMAGTAWSSDAVVGRSLFFNLSDGNNEYVDLPDGFADFTGGITVDGLTKPASMKNWSRIPLDFGNGAGNANILLANIAATTDLRFEITGAPVLDVNGVFTAGAWQRVVATCGPGTGNATARVYKNGSAIGTSTTFTTPANVTRVNNYLGKSNWPDQNFRDQMGSGLNS